MYLEYLLLLFHLEPSRRSIEEIIVRGETSLIKLITGILGYVSQTK